MSEFLANFVAISIPFGAFKLIPMDFLPPLNGSVIPKTVLLCKTE